MAKEKKTDKAEIPAYDVGKSDIDEYIEDFRGMSDGEITAIRDAVVATSTEVAGKIAELTSEQADLRCQELAAEKLLTKKRPDPVVGVMAFHRKQADRRRELARKREEVIEKIGKEAAEALLGSQRTGIESALDKRAEDKRREALKSANGE